jgi:hypothetical protein
LELMMGSINRSIVRGGGGVVVLILLLNNNNINR